MTIFKIRAVVGPFKGILYFFLLGFLLLPKSQASGAECGKVKVGAQEDCKELSVNFDLTDCAGESGVHKAKVTKCAKDSATAVFSSTRAIYRAEIKKFVGSMGNVVWTVPEQLNRTPVVSTPAPVPVHVEPTKKTVFPANASVWDSSPRPVSPPKPILPPATETEKKVVEEAKHEEVNHEELKHEEHKTEGSKSEGASPAGLSFGGIFDTYYAYNFNRPKPHLPTSSPNGGPAPMPAPNNDFHLYDAYHNQIAVNLVELTVKKTAGEVTCLVDLDFGQMADFNAGASAGNGYLVDEVSKHIGQAILSYSPSKLSGLTFDVGKMATHIGLEGIKARENWQYSRSITFVYGIPIWHSGVHVGYAVVPSKLNIGGYIYNGWNSLFENNAGKTLGAQVKFTPSESFTLTYNFLGGPEQNNNNDQYRILHEANMVFVMNPTLSFNLELLTGRESGVLPDSPGGSAQWRGMTVATKVQISPKWSVSPRAEIYRDLNGFSLNGFVVPSQSQNMYTYTMATSYELAAGLETRVEYRRDHSTLSDRFNSYNGPSSDQNIVSTSLLYSF